MNEIRDLARDGPIAEFLDRPRGIDVALMSGVSLRLDDYWLCSYLGDFWDHYARSRAAPSDYSFQRYLRTRRGMTYRFDWSVSGWAEYLKKKGLEEQTHPVAVIVLLREPLHDGIPEQWPRTIANHPVYYEYRPEAQLQAVGPGDAVTGISSGTLGGYLWTAKDGRHFAISCAHVFGEKPGVAVGPSVSAGSVAVGQVIESVFPGTSLGKCNMRLQPNTSSVDAAVADLTGGPSIQLAMPAVGKIMLRSDVIDIGQGDGVTLVGAKSGRLEGRVKECNVWKEFVLGGNTYCFSDLLVIESSKHHYLTRAFTQAGDSGAWVVNTSTGTPSWDAMLIGGDGSSSYCCYAENITGKLDPGLSIPP